MLLELHCPYSQSARTLCFHALVELLHNAQSGVIVEFSGPLLDQREGAFLDFVVGGLW